MSNKKPELSTHAAEYPLERMVEYVAALAAVGWVFGYLGWALQSSLLQESAQMPSREAWTATGMGLAGVAGISWFISELLH
jgi:hypothetical protein